MASSQSRRAVCSFYHLSISSLPFSLRVANVTAQVWSTFSTLVSLLLNHSSSEFNIIHHPQLSYCPFALIFTFEVITTFNSTSTFTSTSTPTWHPLVTLQSPNGTAHCRHAVLSKVPSVISPHWVEMQRIQPSSPSFWSCK